MALRQNQEKLETRMVNKGNINLIKNAYDKKLITGNFLPSVFVIEITNYCNLKCIMCPRDKLKLTDLGNMNLELFEHIIKSIKNVAENVMLYFMGEPLLHPNFDKIVSIARKHLKGKITISTNATQLNEKKAKIILACKIDILICCIDHWNAEKYNKIRVGADFNKVVKNINNFINLKKRKIFPKVIIKSLDFGMGEIEKNKFKRYWSDKNANPLVGWVDSWAGQLTHLNKYINEQPYICNSRKPCADLWFKMVINWKGDVIICCHNYNYTHKIGKIKIGDESFLHKIWQGAKLTSLRKKHIEENFEMINICCNCTEWAAIKELQAYRRLSYEDLYLIF